MPHVIRSFTVPHPEGKLASIGVVLNARTFYVNRVLSPVDGPVKPNAKKGASVPWSLMGSVAAAFLGLLIYSVSAHAVSGGFLVC